MFLTKLLFKFYFFIIQYISKVLIANELILMLKEAYFTIIKCICLINIRI